MQAKPSGSQRCLPKAIVANNVYHEYKDRTDVSPMLQQSPMTPDVSFFSLSLSVCLSVSLSLSHHLALTPFQSISLGRVYQRSSIGSGAVHRATVSSPSMLRKMLM